MSDEDEARVREIVNEVMAQHGVPSVDHDGYANPVGGGWDGYQGACWVCDWLGPLREKKPDAQRDAIEHTHSSIRRSFGELVVAALREDERRNGCISL